MTVVSASDLRVRENNIDRDVLQVTRATELLDIALLVDTSHDAEGFIPDFRQGLRDFFRAVGDRHEIALIGFGQRPTTLVDYTRDTRRLEAGVARVYAQPGSGAYLMDGLIETSRGLRSRERSRREVVVITSEGRELSNRNAVEVIDEVRRAGIVVDAFVVGGTQQGVRPAFEAGTSERGVPPAPDQPAFERAVALADAIKRTGGRREDLVAAGALGAKLRELGARLNNQYRVIYDGPPSLTPPASIEIVTTRPDLRAQVMGTPQNRR